VHEPEGDARRDHLLALLVELREGAPDLACCEQQLLDLLGLEPMPAVRLVARVEGEPERADRVGLACL